MLKALLRWIVYALVIMLIALIVPGITIANFLAAMLAVLVIALINTFIKPLLELISLPITFLTLGLFTLVINALLFMLAGAITPGFAVEGFLSALFGSIILSLLSVFINKI